MLVISEETSSRVTYSVSDKVGPVHASAFGDRDLTNLVV